MSRPQPGSGSLRTRGTATRGGDDIASPIARPPVRPLIRPGGAIATFFVGLVVGFVRALPPRVRRALARWAGDFVYVLGIRRAVAFDNLRHAFPELDEPTRRQIAHRAYQNLALAALESLCSDQLPDVVKGDLGALGDAARAGGVLVASAHFGSWELFAEVMSRRGHALSAVVRPLAGAFNAHVVKSRQLAGLELILQRGALHHMIKAVRRGRVVVQLIDQVLAADDGVFVPFFGRPASTTPALSMAALRTKAPAFVALAVRRDEGFELIVEGPVPMPDSGDRRADLTAHTAALTAIVERHIRANPDQWLWLHRRWKVQPD